MDAVRHRVPRRPWRGHGEGVRRRTCQQTVCGLGELSLQSGWKLGPSGGLPGAVKLKTRSGTSGVTERWLRGVDVQRARHHRVACTGHAGQHEEHADRSTAMAAWWPVTAPISVDVWAPLDTAKRTSRSAGRAVTGDARWVRRCCGSGLCALPECAANPADRRGWQTRLANEVGPARFVASQSQMRQMFYVRQVRCLVQRCLYTRKVA